MAVSKAQSQHFLTTCKCGCGEEFSAFPVYRPRSEGGGLQVPDYKRGHHPNCRKTQAGNIPAWNAGLTKEDHPSIVKMGFQFQPDRNPNWLSPTFDHVKFSQFYKNMSDDTRGSKKAYGKFREAILQRDDYCCQDCKRSFDRLNLNETEIHVHHIETVRKNPDRTFDDENVITLCLSCHLIRHGKRRRRIKGP